MAVNATAVWRVRPSGSNTNGGGYDAAISGAGTDYSQFNSAQASGTAGTAAGTTAFSDVVAAAFTSAMVGNALYITGTGLTTGFYFCTAFTDSGHITIDRSPGTGTTGTWHLGGGWADFWTNTTANIVPGNTVYILGSGTPNPASYTYDYSASSFTPAAGNTTVGRIVFANDPATPGYKAWPDTTGGMPCIKGASGAKTFNSCTQILLQGLWLVQNSSGSTVLGGAGGGHGNSAFGCVYDQLGQAQPLFNADSNFSFFACECFSSTTTSSSGTPVIKTGTQSSAIDGCNIHDCSGIGIYMQYPGAVTNNIVAKCNGIGIFIKNINATADYQLIVKNNTVDGNTGNGIEINDQVTVAGLLLTNNIISNHTGAGKSGLIADAGTAAANTSVANFVDYNSFYNNTANYAAINAGPHDTALSTNPYVGQSSENYTLA